MSEQGFGQNQWPRSFSLMREINFWTFWIFELPTFKVISFAMLAETIFFSTFLHSAQDLSHKIGKSWTLLIRVSISLIVEVHGVNGVGERAVMWVEPILLVSVTDSFLSSKVSTFSLYKQNGNFAVRACAKDYFCKKNFKCKRYSVQCFHFWKRKTNWFWRKCVKGKLFSGIISHGPPDKPDACLEPSRTTVMNLFLQRIVNDYKPVTIL